MSIWPSFKEQPIFAWLLSILMSLSIIVLLSVVYLGWASTNYQRTWNDTITVDGEATISQAPTKATIYFSVDSEEATAQEAQADNNATVESLLSLLSDLIVEEDIQTEQFNLYENEVWNPETREYEQNGWVASQRVEVTMQDPDEAGTVLALLGDNGATNVSGPNYEADEDADLEAMARLEAIQQAQEEAESIAGALGKRLGRMVDYSEYSYGEDDYYDYGYARTSAVAEVEEIALSPGTEESTFTVSITYKLR
jgi:uncharacterized protein YggE